MAMTLNKDDLQAIRELLDGSAAAVEDRLMARVDDLDDALSIQLENGLQEVREQLGEVKQSVMRAEQLLQIEIARDDRQDADIKQIREHLHAA